MSEFDSVILNKGVDMNTTANPVHKNMQKFHKPKVHRNKKTDYSRKQKHRTDYKTV